MAADLRNLRAGLLRPLRLRGEPVRTLPHAGLRLLTGIAVFLAGILLPRLARIRVAVLTGYLAFSVIWTAIEKLVYPHWTQEVLSMHSRITMGMNPETFIVLAGFVSLH